LGANDAQTVKAFLEAEAYDGPSIILAYSHCIAHGIDMGKGMNNQKVAVETGYWPLFRYSPMNVAEGKNPFKLDSKAPKFPIQEFTNLETRFKILEKSHPERAKMLMQLAQGDIQRRWDYYSRLETDGVGEKKN